MYAGLTLVQLVGVVLGVVVCLAVFIGVGVYVSRKRSTKPS